MKGMSEEEKELLTLYRKVNERGKCKLFQIARVFAATDTFSKEVYDSASAELRQQIAALEREYKEIMRQGS